MFCILGIVSHHNSCDIQIILELVGHEFNGFGDSVERFENHFLVVSDRKTGERQTHAVVLHRSQAQLFVVLLHVTHQFETHAVVLHRSQTEVGVPLEVRVELAEAQAV